jgi:hypothetical protein
LLGQLRVVSENAFGRLKGRFHILREIPFNPSEAGDVVLAACSLHNYLEEKSEAYKGVWAENQRELDRTVETTPAAFARRKRTMTGLPRVFAFGLST